MDLDAGIDRREDALTSLAQAQARTGATLGALEETLIRTGAAVQAAKERVSRFGDTTRFLLADLALEVVPAYLAQHYGIHGLELERRFFLVEGHELEVDLYGEGRRDGEAVAVIGKVPSRIHGRDVEGAVRQTARLAPQLRGTPVTVLFGFVIHPSAREAARRLGAIVISSSGRA